MLKITSAIVALIATFFANAQVEDESCLPPSKKVLKIMELAETAPDAKTAVDNFNKAITEVADNAYVYFQYAMYAYNSGLKYYDQQPNPTMGDRSFAKAEEMFLNALEHCDDYHADCSYYLGVINYTQKDNKEAVKWFKEFKAFDHKDNDRYPQDYDSKLKDVNEILPELEDDIDLMANVVPFEPKMVPNVSSFSDEYFPMISPDNEIMFFTRKDTLKAVDQGFMQTKVVENFTFAMRPNVAEYFDKGIPLKPPFNDGTFTNYGAATMSVDNKEMIICACKPTDVNGQKYLNCDLYRTEFDLVGKEFVWTPLENLGMGINTNNGWEGQPTLSPDGNTMYFTAMRPTTKDNDIFVTHRLPNGKWAPAEPFDVINTAGKDKSPFLHQDSETLYFVSQVSEERSGVGGLDIYYIRKENGNWTKPKNIGYPINSKEDELGIFVSTDGTLAYYSSRQSGNWNIYAFELYEEARPTGVTILKGELKDEDGNPMTDTELEIAYAGTGEVAKVKVNGSDGKFAAVVKNTGNQDVMVTVKKEGYAFDSKLITKEELAAATPQKGTGTNSVSKTGELQKETSSVDKKGTATTEKKEQVADKPDQKHGGTHHDAAKKHDTKKNVTESTKKSSDIATVVNVNSPKDVSIRNKDLTVKSLKVGDSYTINDILFSTSSWEISERSKFILRQFADYLKMNTSIAIAIEGHTDDMGDDTKNLTLSENRAKAVRDYLIAQGIDAKRLTAAGFGETRPKVENDSEFNRAVNRRTEFVIKKM